MAALIPFTSNYTDVSTYEGYQFEFHCQRCGNGYRSAFRHSVTGFGGRLAALGGGILGGEIGSRVQEVGLLAQWDRSSTRGSTNDKRLLEASEDVAGHFVQCRGCAEWVCRDVCWDARAGCCTRCVPPPAPDADPARGSARRGSGCAARVRPAARGTARAARVRRGYGRSPGSARSRRAGSRGAGRGTARRRAAASGYGPPRVSLRHPGRPSGPAACCTNCGATTAGRFCAQCGNPLAPPACTGCGAPAQGTPSARSAAPPPPLTGHGESYVSSRRVGIPSR